MAKVGNHGQIIPRDRDLLWRLYWDERRTLIDIAASFGVTHRSLGRAMADLGIPRRPRSGKGHSRWTICRKCDQPVHKVRHSGNGSFYGTLCKKHWDEHRAHLARKERQSPERRSRMKAQYKRWYEDGPLNPHGEGQWITKSRALLRSAKRILKAPRHEASSQPSEGSRQDRTLPE